MMNLYKEAAEWAMYNFENFKVFYIMLAASGACIGFMASEFIRTIMDKVKGES